MRGASGDFMLATNQPLSPTMPNSILRAADAAPAQAHAAVTPSDTADIPSGRARGLYVNAAGAITVSLYPGGPAVAYKVGGPGSLRVAASRVWATGAYSAVVSAGIVAWY